MAGRPLWVPSLSNGSNSVNYTINVSLVDRYKHALFLIFFPFYVFSFSILFRGLISSLCVGLFLDVSV